MAAANSLCILALGRTFEAPELGPWIGWHDLKFPVGSADNCYEGEILMITNPVQSSPAAQNEAVTKAAPRPNAAPRQAAVPQDKVTLSPQAQAQVQAQATTPKAVPTDTDHDGDSK